MKIFRPPNFIPTGCHSQSNQESGAILIQTSKLLETSAPGPLVAQNAMRQMGQILFAPPNVKGWDGGKAWISTSTLLFRYNFANYLINGDAMLPAPPAGKQKGVDLGYRQNAAALLAAMRRDPIDVSKIIPADLRAKPAELVAHLSHRLFRRSAAKRARDVSPISRRAKTRPERRHHARIASPHDEHAAVSTLLRMNEGEKDFTFARNRTLPFRGAHAPRVLATAPSPSRTFAARRKSFGEAPKPARGGACAPQKTTRPPI